MYIGFFQIYSTTNNMCKKIPIFYILTFFEIFSIPPFIPKLITGLYLNNI